MAVSSELRRNCVNYFAMLEKCVILAGFSFCNINFQTTYLYYSEFYSYLIFTEFSNEYKCYYNSKLFQCKKFHIRKLLTYFNKYYFAMSKINLIFALVKLKDDGI